MSFKSNLLKAVGLGVVVTGLTAGAAFAAVATTNVNVRSGPGTSYSVVDQLFPGEAVAITGHSNGWCSVAKPGPNGWVSCAYLSTSPIDAGPDISFGFGWGYPYPHMHHMPPPFFPHPMHPWWW